MQITARVSIEHGRSWRTATNFSSGPDVSFPGEAEVGRAAEFAASVDNDPEQNSFSLYSFRRGYASGIQRK